MKLEYRVVKHVYPLPGVVEYGWWEIRWVHYEGDQPRLSGTDRGVHGHTTEELLGDFALYHEALAKPVFVISADTGALLREDPPIFTTP